MRVEQFLGLKISCATLMIFSVVISLYRGTTLLMSSLCISPIANACALAKKLIDVLKMFATPIKGIGELTKEFKGLTNLFLYSRESKGFNKIACSLLRNRNIVAHGGYLETNSATMAKYITDYIALYIYTFAMYRK